jgi:hypothetical protein
VVDLILLINNYSKRKMLSKALRSQSKTLVNLCVRIQTFFMLLTIALFREEISVQTQESCLEFSTL